MKLSKEIWMSGFALFSMFFGAGNLILPPLLGLKASDQWLIVTLGFSITAVVIPILAIYAHAKLQGTLFDFGKKVSPVFSYIYCILIYIIAIALPAPRTASVTHEMAIAPFFNVHTLWTSSIYFALVLLFVLNRSKILSVLGKLLTPAIALILLLIIVVGFSTEVPQLNQGRLNVPFVDGILEGYQTFDAIGGVVVGAVLIVSLQLRGHTEYSVKKNLIIKSGWIAGTGLILIYGGLILLGARFSFDFESGIDRTRLLSGLSLKNLGNIGRVVLSVLVALACFTTAVGVVTGASDFFKSLFNESQRVYKITAVVSCVIGVLVGSFEVGFIIDIAIPSLMVMYPITIVLIVLNLVSEKFSGPLVFKWVVITALCFSLPEVLLSLGQYEMVEPLIQHIPLAQYNLGWVIPSIAVFFGVNGFLILRSHSSS